MDSDWFKMLAYAVFAAIGGFIGTILRTMDQRLPIDWGKAALEGIAAGFVGLLVLLLCMALELSASWTGVIVGVCGWMGANASIRLLEAAIFRKLGITKQMNHVRERKEDADDSDAS